MEKAKVFIHDNLLLTKFKPALNLNNVFLGATINNNQLLQEESGFDSGKISAEVP